MALAIRLSFVSVDNTLRTLTVKDSTGVYSEANPGGYGTPNPSSFVKAIFIINHFNSTDVKVFEIPDATDIINGVPLVIDSKLIGNTNTGEPLEEFSDGVLEITYNLILNESVAVYGAIGDKKITGSGLELLLEYDHVLISNQVYRINKSEPHNAGTVIHLTTPLKAIAVAASKVASANLKVLMQGASDKFLVSSIGKMAMKDCTLSSDKLVKNLSKLFMWKFAAQVAFDCKDYKKADDLLHGILNYRDLIRA